MPGKTINRYYRGSILLSDEIEKLVMKGTLIVDGTFNEQQLRTAKYDARLGRIYYKDEKFGFLDNKTNPTLEIGPYELVFVESYENFKLPKNVIGKYDLRISNCLGGIGLQTGLHLDPTYYGKIFSPLFNFSDKKVRLQYMEHLASIEFIYTTPPNKRTKSFQSPRQGLLSLIDALPSSPGRSGLERLWSELAEFDKAATRLHTRVDTMIAAVYGAMAFMIAALAVMAAAISIVITSNVLNVVVRPLSIALGIISFLFVVAIVLFVLYKIISKISEGNGKPRQPKHKVVE
ncbi:MAG: hypothetical protein MUO89_09580 [Dehalococcoidia bacterium]|nr:hypothetical protein [Dehalococcoidia bacterium]